MKEDKKISLSTQINLIFTVMTFLTSVLFIVVFKQTINNFTNVQADRHFVNYNDSLLDVINEEEKYPKTDYYGYVYVLVDNDYEIKEIVSSNYQGYINDAIVINILNKYKIGNVEEENKLVKEYRDNIKYILNERGNRIIITFSNGSYALTLREPISNIITIGFISIIILGNAIILLWSSVTVERIKKLEEEVAELGLSNYDKKVTIEGNDEITDLAEAIDSMRKEIYQNEKVKQEMLQNISHDIKTPIAVIRSYAEAIKDGISDISEVDIIIKQSEVLSKKVIQLLEWNKLEYLNTERTYYPVALKKIILDVANNYKYRSNINFILDLDNSKFNGIEENFYSVINNIIENALRYAKTVIKVTLENEKLTIYNDGEHISDEFINSTFKPYEKGHKGQFGLGMTIVQRTINNFGLRLIVENNETGVSFIIEPRE